MSDTAAFPEARAAWSRLTDNFRRLICIKLMAWAISVHPEQFVEWASELLNQDKDLS